MTKLKMAHVLTKLATFILTVAVFKNIYSIWQLVRLIDRLRLSYDVTTD